MTTDGIGTVLLAGATGGTGKRALDALLAVGYEVRCVTRSESAVERLHRRGADGVVVGDLLDPATAVRAVEGCDAVLSCVGTSPTRLARHRMPWTDPGPLVDGEGNRNLVAAAAAGDPWAFVMQSALGTGGDRGSWMAHLFRLTVGPTLRAKATAEEALRASGLRHTVLRPGALTDLFGVGPLLGAPAGTGLWGIVPRRDVARVMVGTLVEPEAANETIEVVRNPFQGSGGSIQVADWGPTVP
ncbi:3-beta hydroxysteroid dehydrogenase [Halobacteriales archaeon QS_8_69_26]|nr:MAG: 3-beta hydroxysteroid dehydrogenase [Halobacteriales archaeon QS_8_69_26]